MLCCCTVWHCWTNTFFFHLSLVKLTWNSSWETFCAGFAALATGPKLLHLLCIWTFKCHLATLEDPPSELRTTGGFLKQVYHGDSWGIPKSSVLDWDVPLQKTIQLLGVPPWLWKSSIFFVHGSHWPWPMASSGTWKGTLSSERTYHSMRSRIHHDLSFYLSWSWQKTGICPKIPCLFSTWHYDTLLDFGVLSFSTSPRAGCLLSNNAFMSYWSCYCRRLTWICCDIFYPSPPW